MMFKLLLLVNNITVIIFLNINILSNDKQKGEMHFIWMQITPATHPPHHLCQWAPLDQLFLPLSPQTLPFKTINTFIFIIPRVTLCPSTWHITGDDFGGPLAFQDLLFPFLYWKSLQYSSTKYHAKNEYSYGHTFHAKKKLTSAHSIFLPSYLL